MTTEQLSSSKKTWAQLAEEEDDEIENGQFTTNSETLDRNEIPSQPTLTKSISEFQPKTRNDRQKNNKQRDQGNNGLKNYHQNNAHQYKGNNRHNRQNKNAYDEVYDTLFETTNQEILLKVKSQNKNQNLEAVKEYFEKEYQNIKAFLRNDINQIDLLVSPKIALLILEDHKFKIFINDSCLSINYPQYPNEPLSEYYAKKKYLEKEKKVIQAAPLFQRSVMNSKVNDQQDCNEKSDNGIKQDFINIEKVQNDQNYIYNQKDNLENQEQIENNQKNKSIYEEKDSNKQSHYKTKKYNNNYNQQYEYEENCKEYKEDKQSNYKSYKYRNEQHSAKDTYQNQKYYSNQDYEYTEKSIFDKNEVPYEEKESHKDYRNNQNYQNYNNNNNNNHYNQKRSYKGNIKQKNDQYVIYEVKQKQNYDEVNNNIVINNNDNLEGVIQVNINQPIYNSNDNEDKNEDKNEDIQDDNKTDPEEEQVEINKSPNKNKKKKKNKKNQKALKPNDTNFFGILQSATK